MMHKSTSELRELARIIGEALIKFASQPTSESTQFPVQFPSMEFTTEPVAAPMPKAVASANAEWLRASDVQKLFGIKRSHLYQLINDRSIRSVCLRRRGYLRGVRLIHRESVAEWIEKNEHPEP